MFVFFNCDFIRTAKKKRRIETAQSQLDGIPFEFANRRNHEPCEKIQIVTTFVLQSSKLFKEQGGRVFFVKETIFLRNCKSLLTRYIILTDTSRNEEVYPLTEAHAAEPLKDRQYDNPADVALAFDAEHQDHEDQYQGRLTAHNDELRDHVGE